MSDELVPDTYVPDLPVPLSAWFARGHSAVHVVNLKSVLITCQTAAWKYRKILRYVSCDTGQLEMLAQRWFNVGQRRRRIKSTLGQHFTLSETVQCAMLTNFTPDCWTNQNIWKIIKVSRESKMFVYSLPVSSSLIGQSVLLNRWVNSKLLGVCFWKLNVSNRFKELWFKPM